MAASSSTLCRLGRMGPEDELPESCELDTVTAVEGTAANKVLKLGLGTGRGGEANEAQRMGYGRECRLVAVVVVDRIDCPVCKKVDCPPGN